MKDLAHDTLKSKIREMNRKLKEEKIQEATKLDQELSREYESMTESEKVLKDSVDQIFETYDTSKDGMLNIKEFTQWLNTVQN